MNDNQIIKEQLDNAPQEIKDFLSRGPWNKSLTNIAKANHLSADQISELENEVLFVLLGMDLASNFAKNVQDNVKVPSLLAGGIALDIDREIFAPVRDFLPTEVEPDANSAQTTTEATKAKTLSEEILGAAVHKEGELSSTPIPEEMKAGGIKFEVVSEIPSAKPEDMKHEARSMNHEVKSEQEINLQTPELEMARDEIVAPATAPATAQAPVPTIPQNTALEQKVAENLSSNESGNRIVVDQYKGPDPYREPIQ